jgi:hypothetical protein
VGKIKISLIYLITIPGAASKRQPRFFGQLFSLILGYNFKANVSITSDFDESLDSKQQIHRLPCHISLISIY